MITSFDVLPMFQLVQPWLLLAFLAARAHCWSMPRLPSASTPCSSSAQLLPIQSCVAQGTSEIKDSVFVLAEFQKVTSGSFHQPPQLFSLPMSLWMAALSSALLSGLPFNLQSSTNGCRSRCLSCQQYNIYHLCLFHKQSGGHITISRICKDSHPPQYKA